MAIVYDKLFALLKENSITSYTLRKMKPPFISQATLTAIKSGKGGLDHRTINNICRYFNCQPGDIMEYIPDDQIPPPSAEQEFSVTLSIGGGQVSGIKKLCSSTSCISGLKKSKSKKQFRRRLNVPEHVNVREAELFYSFRKSRSITKEKRKNGEQR